MKRNFFLLAFLTGLMGWTTVALAQQKRWNYDSAWTVIDSLIWKKGLNKSALSEVQSLYERAKKENQPAQIIRCLVYELSLRQNLEEDATVSGIRKIKMEASSQKGPAVQVLQSLLASAYWNYFQQVRYRIYDRPPVENPDPDNPDTWSAADFHREIGKHFQHSLEPADLLKKTTLEVYDPIIIKGNSRTLRPSLYDLLAHTALSYFETDERDLFQPGYHFEISDPAAFAPVLAFSKHAFTTRDSSSLYFRAILIYQNLIRWHLEDKDPEALADLDINRLSFIFQYAVMENKDSLYRDALNELIRQYQGNPLSAKASYLLAAHYFSTGNYYEAGSNVTTHRFDWVRAWEIASKAAAQYPDSEGGKQCRQLLQEIGRKELNLQSENVNLPNQPFRMLVNWKNFGKVYYRIIRLDESIKARLSKTSGDDYWKLLTSIKALRSSDLALPLAGDYRNHSLEMKVDPLPSGHYALLACSREDFKFEGDPIAVQMFYVSAISFIRNGDDYFVLHRETGKPLEKASVQVWEYQYDYSSRSQKKVTIEKIVTGKEGFFHLANIKENSSNLRLKFIWQKDQLELDDYHYIPYRETEEEEEPEPVSFLFADRGLYRPGQTVYFKGIVLKKDSKSKKFNIQAGFNTRIELYDANSRLIDSLDVTTNEYGSYSGSFHIPQNLLTGSFSIEDFETDASLEFRVEEYKRPRFFVQFDTTKGTYRLGDTVTISGKALAFSGNPVDGAPIKYRVVRETRFPYPWLYPGRLMPQPASRMEISNGSLVSGTDGSFNIPFKAIPDLQIPVSQLPVFEYHVFVDVTDLNGETQSGENWVQVGYQAMELQVTLPDGESFPADSLKNIHIYSRNTAGLFQPAWVILSLYELEGPDRLIRPRYWNRPDTFVLGKEEYLSLFPNDEYDNETQRESWSRGKRMLQVIDSTHADGKFKVEGKGLPAGWYLMEAIAKDKYGDSVKYITYVELIGNENDQSVLPSYWTSKPGFITVNPGEQATIRISSSATDLWIIQKTARREETIQPEQDRKGKRQKKNAADPFLSVYQFIGLSNQSKEIQIPATDSDKGGFGVQYAFVKHNRIFFSQHMISVPWSDKELKMGFATFRDKLQPGSREEWKIRVSGQKGEKVAAEMLTAMYDASLDKLYPFRWQTPDIYPTYYPGQNWMGGNSFKAVPSISRWYEEKNPVIINKIYDQFLWSQGLNPFQLAQSNIRIRGLATPGAPGVADSSLGRLQGKVAGVQVNDAALEEVVVTGYSKKEELTGAFAVPGSKPVDELPPPAPPQIRQNFNETAFFFPALHTDSAGTISFTFTLPESLTQWKWQLLAHSKELAFGQGTKYVIAQKQLMVQPNFPRFLREGDQIHISAKISSLLDSTITGEAFLQLYDPETLQPVDGWFQNLFPRQYFTAGARQSAVVDFILSIPFNYNRPLGYRVIASAGSFSDGEENMLPVLTNRILITESLPLYVKGNEAQKFRFQPLLTSSSESLTHHRLTVEYSTNPAWYGVQALPYLTEFPYECTEQLFNRFYAHSLAYHIFRHSPRVQAVIAKWKAEDTLIFRSNLEKNEALKSILLEETPWVMEAAGESEQQKELIRLFDSTRMKTESAKVFEKLKAMQTSNGGFVWFKGGPDDRFITQYILSGIGHLHKLGAFSPEREWENMIRQAISYLDQRIAEDYDQLLRRKADLKKNNLEPFQIQYLYMRSFFSAYPVASKTTVAYQYYLQQEKQFWIGNSRMLQAMISLTLYRNKQQAAAGSILASLKENAIHTADRGMYWKEPRLRPYWYEAPTESQALLIEAFQEIGKDSASVNQMKAWLLFQKQTSRWESTKATADACYALLLRGEDWLSDEPQVTVKLGSQEIISPTVPGQAQKEPGTGYVKKTVGGKDINPSMGDITVKVSEAGKSGISWGAVYWQYFENLDQVKEGAAGLQLKKSFYLERAGDKGPELIAIKEGDELSIGDKIRIRIELKADRDYEYVHLRDMRASGTEPLNVLSGYKWQGGLGYYEMTKDAASHFFMSSLPRGTYIFEYPLFISQSGTFSAGVATIECMYAPVFNAHSEGMQLKVNPRK